MPSLKDVKIKIAGVGKTKQITKAMNMVASAKLRGAQTRMQNFRAYADRFLSMFRNITADERNIVHPLLTPHAAVRAVGIILATSDRGLCGGFNAALVTAALNLARRKREEGADVIFYCIGRKGRDAIRKAGLPLASGMAGAMTAADFRMADRIGADVIGAYLREELDEVVLVYSSFVSLMRQSPTLRTILPARPGDDEDVPGNTEEYLCEPGEAALLDMLLPRIVKTVIYRGLLHTATSENAARMTAMDNATRNCDDLTRTLIRLYNKTRQASITSSLIDIVGGVEALKG
jgi:F-type H+-transporting ATPase subunit gamma